MVTQAPVYDMQIWLMARRTWAHFHKRQFLFVSPNLTVKRASITPTMAMQTSYSITGSLFSRRSLIDRSSICATES